MRSAPDTAEQMLVAIGICPLAAISGYPAAASFVTECDRGLGVGALEPSIWTATGPARGRSARADGRICASSSALDPPRPADAGRVGSDRDSGRVGAQHGNKRFAQLFLAPASRGCVSVTVTVLWVRKERVMQPTTTYPVQFSVDYPD